MKKQISIVEKYGPAMELTDQAAADAYFEECVEHSMRSGLTPAEAETLERKNLGYYAGYYGSDTRERVERLFKCAHPIFGPIAENGPPTAKEAFAAGMVAATSGIEVAAKLFGPTRETQD